MTYTYQDITMVVLALRSGSHRALITVDGNPAAFEDSPSEFQAYMNGLHTAARLAGVSAEELTAAWGRPANRSTVPTLLNPISAYNYVPRPAFTVSGKLA